MWKLNRAVVLVTHDMDEAIYLSGRILILNRSPARITHEIVVEGRQRDRQWLYGQGELRKEIYDRIMAGVREVKTYDSSMAPQ